MEQSTVRQGKVRKAKVEKPEATTNVREFGVNLEVSGSVLAAQAAARILWHEENAARIKAELTAMTTDESSDDWQLVSRRTDLVRLVLTHEDHARFLAFVKQHLKRRRVYRIGFADMMALELTPKGSCP